MAEEKKPGLSQRLLAKLRREQKTGDQMAASSAVSGLKNPEPETPDQQTLPKGIDGDMTRVPVNVPGVDSGNAEMIAPENEDELALGESRTNAGQTAPQQTRQQVAEAAAGTEGDTVDSGLGKRDKALEQKGQPQSPDQAAQKSPQEAANQKPGMVARAGKAMGNAYGSIRNRGKAKGAGAEKEESGGDGQAKQSAGGKAVDGVNKAKDAVDLAQKGARALAGDVSAMAQLALKGVKELWKDPKKRWIIIIGGGGGLIVVIIAIAIPFSFLSALGGHGPNAVIGHTQPQLVNPIENKDVVRQTLALAGDATASSDITDSGLTKAQEGILTTRDQYASKTDSASLDIVNKIDLVTASIATLKATKAPANATAFLDRLAELDDAIEGTFAAFSVDSPTKSPVLTKDLVFNTELHGGSKLRPDHVDNNGVYTAYDQGVCDAVDLSADSDSLIYPIFAGTIINVSDDGTDGKKVVIQNGDYQMLYAHLTDVPFAEGTAVGIDKSIGKVKIDHIQIETIYQHTCLTTTYGDLIDHAKVKPRHDNIGGYLWDRIVEKFHISV